MNTKIIVCCHKDPIIFDSDLLFPIHVGKKTSPKELGIQGDDTGINISGKNGLYCELTGTFWAWKNLHTDYIGICHYRRFFSFKCKNVFHLKARWFYQKLRQILNVFKHFPFSNTAYFKSRYCISNVEALKGEIRRFESDFNAFINKHPSVDVFALKEVVYGTITNEQEFSSVCGRYHVDVLMEIVESNYPELYPSVVATLKSNRLHYANMIIMKKETFGNYCGFLFDVLERHLNTLKENNYIVNENEKAINRLSGYLGELLTSSYVEYIKNKDKNRIKLLSQIQFEGV